MQVDVARDRERKRETRPGPWVAAARREAARREKKPVSQMELAIRIERDRNTVARWEMSEGEVDFVVWLGVLHALGLPRDWLPEGVSLDDEASFDAVTSPRRPRPTGSVAGAPSKRGSGRRASTTKARSH